MSVMAFDLASALASIKGPNVVAAPWDAAVAGGGSYSLPSISTSAAGSGGGGTGGVSTQTLMDSILNSPIYKNTLSAIDQANALQQRALDLQLSHAQQDAAFTASRASSSGGGGGGYVGPADPTAAERKALMNQQIKTAEHNTQLAKERSREVLGSRGMINSGQVPFEQNELQFQYDSFVKELQLQEAIQAAQAKAAYEARKAAASAASSAGQAGISSAVAASQLGLQQTAEKIALARDQLAFETAQRKADALLGLSTQPQLFISDASGGYTSTTTGQTLTTQQAQAIVQQTASYTPPPAPPAPAWQPSGPLMGPGSATTPWVNPPINATPSLQGLLAATGFR